MNMKNKTKYLIILCVAATSCSTVLPPGLVTTQYPSGKTHLRYYVSDGVKNGPWEEYDETGNLMQSGSFFKDQQHGYFYEFISNRVVAVYKFEHDLNHGTSTTYFPDGSIQSQHRYEMGVWKGNTLYGEDGTKVQDITINQ